MSPGWARSLRQEATLQDQYRQAVHACTESSGVPNVSLNRWEAACSLQKHIDSAKGDAKCLATSRAINARFSRRAVMTDLQGAEMLNIFSKAHLHHEERASPFSSLLDDSSLTRLQALENFGIDLTSVGTMTRAQTESRQSSRQRKNGGGRSPRGALDIGRRVERNCDVGNRGKHKTLTKRGHGGVFSGADRDNRTAAAKRQEASSTRLERVDNFISGEFITTARESGDTKSPDNEGAVLEMNASISIESVARAGAGPTNHGTAKGIKITEWFSSEPSRPKAPGAPAVVVSDQGPCSETDAFFKNIRAPHAIPREEVRTPADVNAHNEAPEKQEAGLRARYPDWGTSDKGLPKNRPYWSWLHFLPQGITDITVPDMVTVVPCTHDGDGDDDGEDCGRSTLPLARPIPASKNGQHMLRGVTTSTLAEIHPPPLALLWFSSRMDYPKTCSGSGGKGLYTATRERVACGTSGKDPQSASSSETLQEKGCNLEDLGVNCPLPTAASVWQRFHAETVQREEELQRAARAVCECGRRGGGGEGLPTSASRAVPRLPLALLKLWHGSYNNRARTPPLSSNEGGKGAGRRRRRNLTVIPLWTEHDVVEALRDMAKGRWGQPPLHHAHDGDTCCVQAFVKSVGTVFKRQPVVSTYVPLLALRPSDKIFGGSDSLFEGRGVPMSPAETERDDVTIDACCAVKQESAKARTVDTASNTHVNHGRGVACHDIADSTEQVGRGPFTHPEHFGSCSTRRPSSSVRAGPIFYRAAWRRNGCKTFVWKVTSRCAQFSPKR